MQYWLWSAFEESWEVVKNSQVWATRDRKVCDIIRKGDVFIFYVKGTLFFKGIFKVVSDWYETKELIWEEEIRQNKKRAPYQIDLQPILLGEVNYKDLVPQLNFIEKKHNPHGYLMGTRGGPANYRKPLEESDYMLIFEEMQKNPLIQRILPSKDHIIKALEELKKAGFNRIKKAELFEKLFRIVEIEEKKQLRTDWQDKTWEKVKELAERLIGG